MIRFTVQFTSLLLLIVGLLVVVRAESPRVLSHGQLPQDKRLGPLTDLYKNYFGCTPPSTRELWNERANRLRRQTRVACGLWPMPTRTPANPVVHGKVDRDDYTVEKVYFESFPGHFVTGNLYRPKHYDGKRPGILSPHGHWENGRFYDRGAEANREDLIKGHERFELSGRYPLQARCVQLARMGCVVFHYDMVGFADSVQLEHRAGVREAMNTAENWGYFSVQAELRLQGILGLQTYNSVRALDWLSNLDDVDPERIGVTGASGGGTQTFLLTAIDSRPAAAFPAVMVSTGMQGGCSCENACYLRVGTGNIELAGLTAPRPLGMTGADDWTKEITTKGLPELKAIYSLFGAEDQVMARALVQFPHNYNYVSRAVMYPWFNQHLKLGWEEPIVEADFTPLSQQEMTVWNQQHPQPAGGADYERSLLRWITADSNQTMAALVPTDKASWAEYRKIIGGAWDILIGRSLPQQGAVKAIRPREKNHNDWTRTTFLLSHAAQGEEVPALMLMPNPWNKQVVIWSDQRGKQGLFTSPGTPRPAVRKLLSAGTAVLGLDLLGQGEFTPNGQPSTKQRLQTLDEQPWKDYVAFPWSKFAGFTFGYNHSLFSQRVHDILSAIAFARDLAPDKVRIALVGLGGAGHWVTAAHTQAGTFVERAAIDTQGFRFASVEAFDDPDFVPGAVKYLDLPGLIALSAPGKLWLTDAGNDLRVIRQAYQAAGSIDQLTLAKGSLSEHEMAIAEWLLGPSTSR